MRVRNGAEAMFNNQRQFDSFNNMKTKKLQEKFCETTRILAQKLYS